MFKMFLKCSDQRNGTRELIIAEKNRCSKKTQKLKNSQIKSSHILSSNSKRNTG